jgi:Cys-tRNA(Pro)/Cys-tRNA(Cys) deacylase
MRILDQKKVDYEVITYDVIDGKIDGKSVSLKINRDSKEVYKTLVAQGQSRELYVFVLPVEEELDLKKAAQVALEKNISMLHVKDIQKYTGYIRGGCSPIGMKKSYKTFINETAEKLDKIIISGGRIGTQIEIEPHVLIDVIGAEFKELIRA